MTTPLQDRLRAFRIRALAVGVVSLAACFVGGHFRPDAFYQGYLFGYLCWLGLAIGCMTVTMVHYLTGGRWGYPLRRFLEAGFGTLPVMLVLFVPLVLGMGSLYPWARPELVAADAVLGKRAAYMNGPWFVGRALFWFALWSLMAVLLRRWSLTQDRTTDVGPSRRLRTLSAPGLILLAFSATFAYVDWIMSLEKDWYSQVFGIVVLAGQVLVTFAFAVLVLRLFGDEPEISDMVGTSTFHQIGNLMLAFVLFWWYVAFAQWLIIYSGNLPHEITWYLHRSASGWHVIVVLLAIFHFFFPFTLLLLRSLKESPVYLTRLAILVAVAYLIEVFWYVAPTFHPGGFHVTWFDVVAPVGVGGVWLAAFSTLLARAPLRPGNDPRMIEEIEYGPA